MVFVFIGYLIPTYAMTLIERALQSPDVVEAPRCFERYFWSRSKFFRGAWVDIFSMMKKSNFRNPLKTSKSMKSSWFNVRYKAPVS